MTNIEDLHVSQFCILQVKQVIYTEMYIFQSLQNRTDIESSANVWITLTCIMTDCC